MRFGEHQEMNIEQLQELLKNKNPKMTIRIKCDDTKMIYDLCDVLEIKCETLGFLKVKCD